MSVWVAIAVGEQIGAREPQAQLPDIFTADVGEALSPTSETFLPVIIKQPSLTPTRTPKPTATQSPTLVPTAGQTAVPVNSPIIESFKSAETSWKVTRDTAGSGTISRSNARSSDSSNAALASSSSSGSKAQLRVNFSEPAGAHVWMERPGTWFWQRTGIYLPSATVQQLGTNDYITLAGLWPSSGGSYGWWLRVRQNGQMYVMGYDANGAAREFKVYGVFPQDQWVDLTLGLHSQNGPGVKRAFGFLVNGSFYGWYHQGHLQNETYDRAAVGILDTNSSKSLQVFVDGWRSSTTGAFPDGPDNRTTANVDEQNYRGMSGEQWQIDWSTWGSDLRMNAAAGLFSANDRLQSGRNLDRMPDITNGWAEIEIDWPNGTPLTTPNGYFGPMVGFRKEINREENLEIIPIGRGGGAVDLVLEAWVNGGPVSLAQWSMPLASIGGSHIPEPGDIIRVRWEQLTSTQLSVKASYFDASASTWNKDVINTTINNSNIGEINFNDGYHKASSITIDSTSYSIRRFKVGVLATYP